MTFAGTRALSSVDMDVLPGETHGLLGQNGSGKSTLIKILSGVYEPDPGALIEFNGKPLQFPLGPGESRRRGLGFVHQDLALAPTLSVLDNMRTDGFSTGFGGRIQWRKERAKAREALSKLGLDIDPMVHVAQLTAAERAIVALARSLNEIEHVEGAVLVLDEPTAYLPRADVERLFAAVRETTASGSAVVFVTHRMEEVSAICDRATVLRDGSNVGAVELRDTSEVELMHLIVGRRLEDLEPHVPTQRDDVVLRARHLSGRIVRDVSFDLHRGEILGLTGLVGMGHDEIPYLLVGMAPEADGELCIDGAAVALDARAARRAGLAVLPADRIARGGVQSATVKENVSLPALGTYFRSGWLRAGRERADVATLLRHFDVRPPEPDRVLATLSGGNQQKALLAKWLQLKPKVLVLHEPTQGIDVGARLEVIGRIRRLAGDGLCVLIVSSDAEDLERLCDRVHVFRDGAVVSTLAGADVTHDRITERSYATSTAVASG
jgi:ribose transport system ATP-binding protein